MTTALDPTREEFDTLWNGQSSSNPEREEFDALWGKEDTTTDAPFDPGSPLSAFRAKLADPKEYERIKKWAAYHGMKIGRASCREKVYHPV